MPASRVLEGVDLGPQRLEQGHIYDVEPRVAKVLVVWEYAERLGDGEPSTPARKHSAR